MPPRKREKVEANIQFAIKLNKYLSIKNRLLLEENTYDFNISKMTNLKSDVEVYNDEILNELLKYH